MTYQLSTLKTPEGRINMEKQLKGKLWTMSVAISTKFHAFLLSNDFQDLVYFPYRELGIQEVPAMLSKWQVEVSVSYNFSKGCYRYSVLKAVPAAAAAPKPAPKPQQVSQQKPAPVSQQKPAPKPQPVAQQKPAPVSQPKPAPVAQPKPAPKPQQVSQPKPAPKPQPVPKSAPQANTKDIVSKQEAMRHAIMNLKPSPSWTVLIDETGDRFVNDEIPNAGSRLGKTVALLLPESISLPQLPMGWHAKDVHEQLPQVIHDLLASPCGIIGLTVNELPRMNANLWSGSIRTLMDMIARLLPISEKTSITFLVEEHSDYTPENGTTIMKGLCDDIHLQLGRVNPKRANNLSLTAKVISKTGSLYNGYVDAIANCWGSPSSRSRKLVKCLTDICLYMDTDGQGFGNFINKIVSDQSFDAQEWTELLRQSLCYQGNLLVRHYLDDFAQRISNKPETWKNYLDATRQHLESKDIDQRLLGQQIAWLKAAMPAETELTEDLQLLWMTAELAEANHLGKVISDPELKSMFSYLTEHLMDEEPRLVAWATLNLSVAYTNAFDFESAEAIMDIWDRKPMQVLGHQYTGQIQSTLGQLAAFWGDNEEAVPLFDQAISNFAKMSNKLKSSQDIEQTTTYKLIAMLDLGLANTPDFDHDAERYFNLPLEQAALFVPQDPAQRYKHHVLLRMLVSGDYPQAREAYLSQRQNWLTGAYHPWELIEFYRALLLDGDLNAQLRHLDTGFDIAKGGDATLHVIAAVILGSRLALADGRLDEYQALLDTIADELPDLGKRLDVLRAQPQAKLPPLELAARVLPFNFK